MQKATVPQRSPNGAEGADRLRHLVLVRIACALRGAIKAEIAADLAPIATGLPAAQWRAKVDREIEALGAQGFVTAKSARLEVSEAGKAQVARFLGIKGDFPRMWSALRDIRLVAVALGMQREPAKRLKALDTLDGLRGAIVESAYNLKVKRGVATPARLREALAAMALKRAFGDKGTAGLAGKLGLSAKASRTLAAQLSREPRDFGTDTRLIAALAGEYLDTAATDIGGLRVAVLRRYFGAASPKAAPAKRKASKRALGKGVQPRVEACGGACSRGGCAGSSFPCASFYFRAHTGVVAPGASRPARLRFRGAPACREPGAGMERGPQGLHQPRVAEYPREAPRLGSLGDRVQVHAR